MAILTSDGIKEIMEGIGVAVDGISVEHNPFETCERIRIDGHICNPTVPSVKKKAGELLGEIITRGSVPASLLMRDDWKKKPSPAFEAKKILKNGDYMTVLWSDGTKTIVKRAPDEQESDYAAFTAALGIKCFGSNSALKRIVESAEVQNKKKKKKRAEESEFDKSEFDKIGRAFTEASKALALELRRLRDADDAYDQQKTDEWLDSVERGQNK